MYQSSMYQLTQSLGAVSMVNIEQIKKQQNLDYLQHLCTFIQKMNMNPIWYENQDVNSKLKILQLYQLAINYSKNMENDCNIAISNQTERINSLSEEERQKTEYIRNMKEQYSQAKQEYKLKKHTLVKKVHTNLKRKIQRMHQNQQYQHQQRQQRTHRSGQETPREIIYYVPNNPPVNQIPPGYPPYDLYNPTYHRDMQYQGYYQPQQPQQHYYPPTQSNNLTPNGGNTMAMHQPDHQVGPFQTNPPNNDVRDPSQNAGLKRSSNQQIFGKKITDSKKSIKQSKEQLGLPNNNNKAMTASQMIRDQFQSYGSGEELDLLQKSNIIAKQDEVLVRMSKQIKKQTPANLQAPSNPKHSVKRSSSFEDDIGDLTVNSKKRQGTNGNIDEQLAQYDSIANININRSDANSRITPKNRFQSKIQNKNQPITPKTTNMDLQTINEQNNDNILDGFPSGLMNSKFSKNSKKGENQPQKLYINSNIPRKNSTKINGTVLKGYEEIKDTSQQPQKIGNEPSKLYKNEKLKRNNKPQPQPLKGSKSKSENPVNILDNIFESNFGNKKVNPPLQPKQNYNSMKSNMGLTKQQNQDSKPQQLYQKQKPKRRSHIQTSSLQPPSTNNLKISFAQSQNGGMIESKAYSIKFSKPNQANTPPQLQKQKQQNYDDDFEVDQLNEKSIDTKQKPVVVNNLDDDDGFDDLDLEHSRIPVSKKISKEEKSEVEINLPSHQTIIEIKKQKYAGLPNDTFILKNQQSQNIIPITSIKNNLDISDNIFDEILQIPMNSVIARRPSTINKLSRISKEVKSLQHLDSLHSSNNLSDNSIVSPSIHIIDPAGRNQTIMNRKGVNLQKIQQEPQISYKQSPRDEAGLKKSGLPIFDAMADSSVFEGQKKTSILELNYVPNQKQKSEKEAKIEDDDSFDINLSEKSIIQKKQSKKSQPPINIAQIRAKLEKIQKQKAKPKNPSIFDKSIIQKAIKTQAKTEINFINTQKWAELEKYYLLQNQKIVEELQKKKKKRVGAKKQQITPRQSKTESYYAQKLQYSKSLAKVENRSGGIYMKNELQAGPVREMTESITINQPKVQQRSSPKNIDNKFATRFNNNKSKNQIQNIKKNLNKNPYERDDELQNVVKQNKSKLLRNQQLSEDDF